MATLGLRVRRAGNPLAQYAAAGTTKLTGLLSSPQRRLQLEQLPFPQSGPLRTASIPTENPSLVEAGRQRSSRNGTPARPTQVRAAMRVRQAQTSLQVARRRRRRRPSRAERAAHRQVPHHRAAGPPEEDTICTAMTGKTASTSLSSLSMTCPIDSSARTNI